MTRAPAGARIRHARHPSRTDLSGAVVSMPVDTRRPSGSGRYAVELQPIVELATGRVRAFECLARRHHPTDEGTRVEQPGAFLPTLDAAGMDDLFRFCLDQAAGLLARWRDHPDLVVTVNLAPPTLVDPRCVGWVTDALARHDVPATRLCLELVEDTPLVRTRQLRSLQRLRALGVLLAMDDLGSAHGTVRRLDALPFQVAKVGHHALQRLRTEPLAAVEELSALVARARAQRVAVVAEGVEDEALAEAARSLGAGLAQGFRYACPMPPDEVDGWWAGCPQPGTPGDPTTPLGGLAWHWRHLASGRAHPGRTPDCPLGEVLDPAPTDVHAWHAATHAPAPGPVPAEDGTRLARWLADRVTAA